MHSACHRSSFSAEHQRNDLNMQRHHSKQTRQDSERSPVAQHLHLCSTKAPGCGSAPALLCPRRPPLPAAHLLHIIVKFHDDFPSSPNIYIT